MITLLLIIKAIRLMIIRKKLSYSQFFVNEKIGFITYICGEIGAGKTTLGCGVTNYLNETLIDSAKNTIRSMTTIYYDVDFKMADSIIQECFKKDILNENIIFKKIIETDPYKDKFSNFKYDNYLQIVPATALLKNYIGAQLALIRNNYVYYYHAGFRSQVTGNLAMPFSPDMMEIKNRVKTADYSIQRYSVIFEDEKQISNKKSTNSQEVASEDGGSDLFLRLIRQLGKGTMYYLTTSQEFGRAVKVERVLATSILYVTKRKVINPYMISNMFFHFFRDMFTACFNIASDFKNRDELGRYKYPAKLKYLIFRCNQHLKKNFAKSFIQYDIIQYHNAGDVGKRLTTYGTETVSLTFPLKYCYGCIDTYAFSIVQDYLVDHSSFIHSGSIDTADKFAETILDKDKKEKETKKKKAKADKKSDDDDD